MVVCKDSSGNGYDGVYTTYLADPTILTFTTGLVAGDTALFCGPFGNASQGGANIPNGVFDWNSDWSFTMWCAYSPTSNAPWDLYQAKDAFENNIVDIYWNELLGNVIGVGPTSDREWLSFPDALPNDGTTHFVALVWESGVLTLYVDNAVAPWDSTGSGLVSTASVVTGAICGFYTFAFVDIGPNGTGVNDECALFDYAISAGDIASMWNAAPVSFDAYTAAVLALSPVAYYHLNAPNVGWFIDRIGMSL